MRITHLVSSRGWSSDAYWAARVARELERRGHEVTLGLRASAERTVMARARREGVGRVVTFHFAGGVHPVADTADVRRIRAALGDSDVVHVHRGKEHWLAAVASRLAPTPRPIVRTRHIVHAVRPHAANRWLYGAATALVVTVTEAIRRQLVASGLVSSERVVTLAGGADASLYRPGPADPQVRRKLGGEPGVPLIGVVAGLRVMKGHAVVIDAAVDLLERGVEARFVFVGVGPRETTIHDALRARGIEDRVTVAGFADDLPSVMRALDVALYVPLESDGMSRVVFELLAAGTALVASRVGVVPEILVPGELALLVPAGDAAALADAIGVLVRDPELRGRLGRSGRALVEERYSGARLAESLERAYTRLRTGHAMAPST
jgi:glycosyltransferase involved in cell wall biosynthesis